MGYFAGTAVSQDGFFSDFPDRHNTQVQKEQKGRRTWLTSRAAVCPNYENSPSSNTLAQSCIGHVGLRQFTALLCRSVSGISLLLVCLFAKKRNKVLGSLSLGTNEDTHLSPLLYLLWDEFWLISSLIFTCSFLHLCLVHLFFLLLFSPSSASLWGLGFTCLIFL